MSQKPQKILEALFLRRYKRFFADFRLKDGTMVTAHCPNPGRMTSCMGENWPSILSISDNPKRKLKYTWEMTHNGLCWIGVNTSKANAVFEEALKAGKIPALDQYGSWMREVSVKKSRLDFLMEEADLKPCYVEIKSVTLMEQGIYYFPDAVTARGAKHLVELTELVKEDNRCILFFVVQRSDGREVRLADFIDPKYVHAAKNAVKAGVEFMAGQCRVEPDGIVIEKMIDVKIQV